MEYSKGIAENKLLEGDNFPSRPRSAETATKSPAQHHSRNPTPGTSTQQTPRYQKTASTPLAFQYVPAPSPPTFHQPTAAIDLLPTTSPLPSRPETFWTLCNRCWMRYEYHNYFLDEVLPCPYCRQPFRATRIPIPIAIMHRSHFWPFLRQQQDVFAASSGSWSVQATQTTVQAQPSGGNLKREHVDAVIMSRGDEALEKKSNVPEKVDAALPCNAGSGGLKRDKLVKKRRSDGQKWNSTHEGSQGTAQSRSGHRRESANLKGHLGAEQMLQSEIRGMLVGKTRMEILSQLNKWNTSESNSPHMKRFGIHNSINGLNGDSAKGVGGDHNRAGFSVGPTHKSKPQKSSTVEDTGNLDETVSMTVPDADFHNFDKDRVEDSFSANQVWAVYDDDDGMPRYYALVHHVISRNPFQMQISWLNSRTTSEFGSLDWIGSGFTKTSGDFRVGKYVFTKTLNSFSHPVKWKKCARGAIQIFPAKGDVWALYRNWSSDWDELTPDEKIHKYDLVVVLEDYNEERGVVVAPLVKVAGFSSVFQQHLDQRETQIIIPKEEVFRFSHQVPTYKLNGQEAENVPEGCYELDPAALPMELLNVKIEAKEAEVDDNAGTSDRMPI